MSKLTACRFRADSDFFITVLIYTIFFIQQTGHILE
jgi:hypothetical protein